MLVTRRQVVCNVRVDLHFYNWCTDTDIDSAHIRRMPTLSSTWFLPATKQFLEHLCLSVCLAVCLSVNPSVTAFSLCSHHRIIRKFSGVITNDKSDVRAKGQGHRSKVKVTEVKTQLSRFRRVTTVWIHIWWWNDAQSLMLLRRGALLFSRSSVKFQGHRAKNNRRFWPKLGVSGL